MKYVNTLYLSLNRYLGTSEILKSMVSSDIIDTYSNADILYRV